MGEIKFKDLKIQLFKDSRFIPYLSPFGGGRGRFKIQLFN
jgi:hypothetical protein